MGRDTKRFATNGLAITSCKLSISQYIPSFILEYRVTSHCRLLYVHPRWRENEANTSLWWSLPLRVIGKAKINKYGIKSRLTFPAQDRVYHCGCRKLLSAYVL